MLVLKPFQKRFIKELLREGTDTAVLTLPRGQGKTTLAAHLAHQSITPGSPFFVEGAENHMLASSIGHSRRTGFGVLKELVGGGLDYRVSDNRNEARIEHLASRTAISVLPASGKAAQGLLRSRWIFADEPAAWKINDGELLFDALQTAQGKPGVDLKVMYLGTKAPAFDDGHWFRKLIKDGSRPGIHVTDISCTDPSKWDTWPQIKRCAPLSWSFPKSRKILLQERDAARTDDKLKSRFMSYRLNHPEVSEESVLLTVPQWRKVLARTPQPRVGRPIVGVDTSYTQSFTGIAAIWPRSMRVEAWGIAPGNLDLRRAEIADGVPRGSYTRLVDEGSLVLDYERSLPRLELVAGIIRPLNPVLVLSDRFRLPRVKDEIGSFVRLEGIVMRWSEASDAIGSLRSLAADGTLNVAPGSRNLLSLSLGQARVVQDQSGNIRLRKGGANRKDDICAALLLAASKAEEMANYRAPRLRWTVVK